MTNSSPAIPRGRRALLRVGRLTAKWSPLDAKATFQAQSAPGDIDHLKITGGKGMVGAEIVGKHYAVDRD